MLYLLTWKECAICKLNKTNNEISHAFSSSNRCSLLLMGIGLYSYLYKTSQIVYNEKFFISEYDRKKKYNVCTMYNIVYALSPFVYPSKRKKVKKQSCTIVALST